MLKKLISTSRKLAALQTDSARLLWTWILPHADITGRFSAEPDVIKGYIVPRLKKMTPAKITNYLLDMAECELILLYKVNSDNYLEIVKFHKFQSLRADREASSEIPPPPAPGSTPGVAPENSGLSKDKIREVKRSKDNGRFTPPSLDDIKSLIKERNYTVDPNSFLNFYASKGWMVGKNKMKDWRAALAGWESRNKGQPPKRKSASEIVEKFHREQKEFHDEQHRNA